MTRKLCGRLIINSGRFIAALPIGVSLALAGPASADTLRDALAATYRTNPQLNAQRESLRATDAGVAIARAAGRPDMAANIGLNRDLIRSGVLDTGRSKGPVVSGGLDLRLPLFEGGRVRSAIGAAKARVDAGRAALRSVEGDLFADAVGAYLEVLRDRAIVDLNRNQVRVLTTNLEATRGLYRSGDLTLTDIAQSEARLNLAGSRLADAQARATASEENYRRLTGLTPGTLAPPPPLPPLPTVAEEAVRIAIAENPSITSAKAQVRASQLEVDVARADRLPSVAGVVSGDYVNTVDGVGGGFPRAGTQTSVGVTSRIPLYQGGSPAARVRQAQALQGQRQEQVIDVERSVVANVRSAFAAHTASQQSIRSSELAVSANQLALEGARAERRVGTRTVIEVLNAEQELLNSQVELISARRNAYLAGFQLLNAMGQAEADDLGLDGGPLYEPMGNYRRVAGNRNDWAGEPLAPARSTRTTETPAGFGKLDPPPVTGTKSLAVSLREELQADTAPVAAPVPTPRPVPVRTAQAAPAERMAKADPLAPAPRSAGDWQIQLGAFRVTGAPQALFARVAGQLGGKKPIYQKAGPFTRLLVGNFASAEEARATCRALKTGTSCMVLRSN